MTSLTKVISTPVSLIQSCLFGKDSDQNLFGTRVRFINTLPALCFNETEKEGNVVFKVLKNGIKLSKLDNLHYFIHEMGHACIQRLLYSKSPGGDIVICPDLQQKVGIFGLSYLSTKEQMNGWKASTHHAAGPISRMIFAGSQLVLGASLQKQSPIIGKLLTSGAISHMLQEVSYAAQSTFNTAISRRADGDFGEILQNDSTHWFFATAALISCFVYPFFTAAKQLDGNESRLDMVLLISLLPLLNFIVNQADKKVETSEEVERSRRINRINEYLFSLSTSSPNHFPANLQDRPKLALSNATWGTICLEDTDPAKTKFLSSLEILWTQYNCPSFANYCKQKTKDLLNGIANKSLDESVIWHCSKETTPAYHREFSDLPNAELTTNSPVEHSLHDDVQQGLSEKKFNDCDGSFIRLTAESFKETQELD